MRKRRVAVTLVATAAAVAAATGSALAFGVFGSPQSIPVHVAYQVALGDLNGDGKTDLAATNDDISTDGFVYALGRGDGSFKPSHFVAAAGGAPEGIAIGKFNSDRRADVALGDFDNSDVEFFFGKKGGGFSTGPISCTPAQARIS